jgi:hypothetical protein
MEVFRCEKRFRVLVAGRRFGKTHLALVELLRASCGADRMVWYVAPTARQAKRIAWNRLKELTRPFWLDRPNESDLSIRMKWGGLIALRGADQYDALRGSGLDFVVLDEYASMRPECWTEVLRPALADRRGGALFIGTPYGGNHLQERFEMAAAHPEWGAFRFTTLQGGNVSEEELVSAASELDERLFRQEFEASFEGATFGQAYHAFSRAENVRRCEYRAGEPLVWSLDFNVHPMCSVLAQCDGNVISVLEEIVLADANTLAACEELARRVEALRGRGFGSGATIQLDIYGDASGHQRRTSGTGTDWSLIREFFDGMKGRFRATLRGAKNNPGVRDRINLVNAKLCSAAGERRLFVDPQCRELLRDLERVRWKVDTTGRPTSELDKSDRMRTHVSDALGYLVAGVFEKRSVGERGERLV